MMEATVTILNSVLLLLFYTLTPALVIHLCRRYSWLSTIGPIMVLYVIGMLFGNFSWMGDEMAVAQDIATNATIDSGVFRNNVSKNIYEIKTPDFVPLIEDNKFNELDNSIDNYLSWYRDKIDLLVLGCTHYPIIRDNIEKYFGNNTRVLDMSELLLDVISDGNNSDIAIYYSKLSNNVIENTKKIMGIDNIKILEKE